MATIGHRTRITDIDCSGQAWKLATTPIPGGAAGDTVTLNFPAALTSFGVAVPTITSGAEYLPIVIDFDKPGLAEPMWITAYTSGATSATAIRSPVDGEPSSNFTVTHAVGANICLGPMHQDIKEVFDDIWSGDTLAGGPFDYNFEGRGLSTIPSGYTWYEQGGAVYLEKNGAGQILAPSEGLGGFNFRGIWRPLPAAASFIVYAKIRVDATLFADPTANDLIYTGLFLQQNVASATTVAVGSNGVNTSTFAGAGVLDVADTSSFTPGPSHLIVATSGTPAEINYTGQTPTSFTGCTTLSGGGVLSTGGAVTWLPTTIVTCGWHGGNLGGDAFYAASTQQACCRFWDGVPSFPFSSLGSQAPDIGSADQCAYLAIQKASATVWHFLVSADGRQYVPIISNWNPQSWGNTIGFDQDNFQPDSIGFGLSNGSQLPAAVSCEFLRIR